MKFSSKFGLCSLVALVFCANLGAQETSNSQQITIPSPEPLPVHCGDLGLTPEGSYGPFDYTNYDHYTTKREIVESRHFTPNVEALISGESSYLIGDIEYTLRVFPNHHRALVSLSKFEFQVEDAHDKLSKVIDLECYFQYATLYKPLDGIVRLIYGTYMHRKGVVERRKEFLERAEMQYNYALQLMPNSAEVHYNLGLFYYDLNKMNLAVMHGNKAYELGFPLQGLKDKLKKKGVWDKTVSQY